MTTEFLNIIKKNPNNKEIERYKLLISFDKDESFCSEPNCNEETIYSTIIKRDERGDVVFCYCYDCSQNQFLKLETKRNDKHVFEFEGISEKQRKNIISSFYVQLARVKQGSNLTPKQDFERQSKLKEALEKKEKELKKKRITSDKYIQDVEGQKAEQQKKLEQARKDYKKKHGVEPPIVKSSFGDLSFLKPIYGDKKVLTRQEIMDGLMIIQQQKLEEAEKEGKEEETKEGIISKLDNIVDKSAQDKKVEYCVKCHRKNEVKE